MKYTKLVIISTNELDSRINDLFGTKELVQKDVIIEYWNLSELTYKVHVKEDTVKGVKTYEIKDLEDFRERVKAYEGNEVLYIVYMNFTKRTFAFYRILSNYKCDMLYCINGEVPNREKGETRYKWLNILPSKMIALIKEIFIYYKKPYLLLKYTRMFYPLKYELHTCKKTIRSYKVNSKTKIIPFNSTDFERTKIEYNPIVQGRYFVYIDQFFPYHPDISTLGMQPLDANKFYSSINRFFEIIEKQYQCPVVIAAHPTAFAFYKEQNPFDGRQIFHGNTAALVKYCDGAFSHDSTAISTAVVYDKPIVLLSSDEIRELYRNDYNYIVCLSLHLNGEIVDLDRLPETFEITKPNVEKYQQYKYDYLTNVESEGISNSEIIYSILRGDYE